MNPEIESSESSVQGKIQLTWTGLLLSIIIGGMIFPLLLLIFMIYAGIDLADFWGNRPDLLNEFLALFIIGGAANAFVYFTRSMLRLNSSFSRRRQHILLLAIGSITWIMACAFMAYYFLGHLHDVIYATPHTIWLHLIRFSL